MATILKYYKWLYDGYTWTLTFSDPRVANWWLMSSPVPTACLTLTYLMCAVSLPRLLYSWPALQLRWLLIIYNAGMVILNGYIIQQLVTRAYAIGYSLVCQPIDFTAGGREEDIAAALWWFYFSKLLEFADSLFFILRKKYNQLSFLHIYHHSTTFCVWWIGVKWLAGGSVIYGPLLNSVVHMVMYGYYALSAAFPTWNFWWKKYITALQMTQFCIVIYIASMTLYVKCPFPTWMCYTLIVYEFSFLVLFGNFYLHAYRAGRKAAGRRKSSDSAANGSALSPSRAKRMVDAGTEYQIRISDQGEIRVRSANRKLAD